MGILSWVVVGLIAGLLGEMATGRRAGGCLAKILIGVLGGLLGGFIFTAAGERGIDEFSLWSLFVAFVGASLLLLVLGDRWGRR